MIRMDDKKYAEDGQVALWEDEVIKKRVLEAWDVIFTTSDTLIKHAKTYGFGGMLAASPNIHQLLVKVRALDQLFDVLIASENLEYDEVRKLLNAKQQLLRMEIVAAAIDANNREDFDRAMTEIENQAKF